MNVEKLKRVAIKEFKRSPAKTGFLLVMLPVALYFCVPLLLGEKKKSSPAASDHPQQAAEFVLPAPIANANTHEATHGSGTWMEVSKCLASDLMTEASDVRFGTRNPFAATYQDHNIELLAAVDDDEDAVDDELAPRPIDESIGPAVTQGNPIRNLGLQLNATMVGNRSRLATINGRTYEEGETIPVVINADLPTGPATTMQLKLTQVDRRFVVLQTSGHQHRLQLRNEIPAGAIIVKANSD